MNDKQISALIKETVESSIRNFFEGKTVEVQHVLDKIFPKERRIRSLIGGLETSLGERLWEPLAKAFAQNNAFEVLDESKFNKELIPQDIPEPLLGCLSKWKRSRDAEKNLSLDGYIKELRNLIKKTDRSAIKYGKASKGEGLDIWLKKDGKEFLYDIKTNQINAGSGPKFNENIMKWYLYRLIHDPTLDISCKIAFPFNPHKGDFWKKEGGKASPLIPSVDAVVGDEFWGSLLGKQNAWQLIEKTFEELGKEKFGEQFKDIFDQV